MEKLKYEETDITVLHEKINCGLDVYMFPMKNINNFYITLTVKLGSTTTEFKLDGEENIKIPNGSSHFLEHKMFEMPNGENAFEFFYNLGASANACTTHDYTSYEVISSRNFRKNLHFLIDMVCTPAFNKESIEREREIITEEIKMYKDSKDALISFWLENNLNIVDKHKYLVSGTERDVQKISFDDLRLLYKCFYNLDNMILIITGNFKPLEALGIIKEELLTKKNITSPNIEIKKQIEPPYVARKSSIFKVDYGNSKLNVAYKLPKDKFSKYDNINLSMYFDAILEISFGNSSEFYNQIRDENLCTNSIEYQTLIRDNYIGINLTLETNYKEQILEMLRDKISNIKIEKEDIERWKRIMISNFFTSFNDPIISSECILNEALSGNIDTKKMILYKSINCKLANEIAKQMNSNIETYIYIKNKNNL